MVQQGATGRHPAAERAGPVQRQVASASGSADAGRSEPGLDPEAYEELRRRLCIGVEPGSGPTRCRFSDREERRVHAARAAARWVSSRAARALDSGDRYIASMARRMFDLEALDVRGTVSTIARIHRVLRSTPVVCGTCADEVCNDAPAAYVPDDLGSIVVCPFFFTLSTGQMRRTFLHEAGHVLGIDAAPDYVHPRNCEETDRVDCDDPCAGISDRLRNVDAWARFIECAGFSW